MTGINRVAFYLFDFPVYWYGLLIGCGLILALLLGGAREKRVGLAKDTLIDFLLRALPVAIICARIYYVIFSWDMYRDDLLSVFNVRQGGLAIYGGVIGGVAVAILFCRRRGISFGALADLCAPSLALGQAIGRWGNFFNQEAYGVVIEREALRFFPAGVYIEADGLWHAATFFYESAWCFLIVITLLILERGGFFRRRGDLFGAYVFLYAAERVVVEGLRLDSLWLGPIRISQVLSGAMMLAIFLLLTRRVMGDRRAMALAAAGCAVSVGLIVAVHTSPLWAQIVLSLAAIAVCALLYAKTPREQGGIGDGHDHIS